jgi:hypothetical protein
VLDIIEQMQVNEAIEEMGEGASGDLYLRDIAQGAEDGELDRQMVEGPRARRGYERGWWLQRGQWFVPQEPIYQGENEAEAVGGQDPDHHEVSHLPGSDGPALGSIRPKWLMDMGWFL